MEPLWVRLPPLLTLSLLIISLVVTPVNKVVYNSQVMSFGNGGSDVGPVTKRLYDRVRGIQNGDDADKFNWMVEV